MCNTSAKSSRVATTRVSEPNISLDLRFDFASGIILRKEKIQFIALVSVPLSEGNASAKYCK